MRDACMQTIKADIESLAYKTVEYAKSKRITFTLNINTTEL